MQAVVDGDGYDGGLLLYVDEGSLSAFEYWWVTEDPPAVMPPLSAIGSPIATGPPTTCAWKEHVRRGAAQEDDRGVWEALRRQGEQRAAD